MAYKFNIRNAANDGWINMLQAQFIEILDSNSKFTATTVEAALEELFDHKCEHVENASAPTATDNGNDIGTIWTDTTTDTPYILTDNTDNANVWVNADSMSDEEIQDIVGAMIAGGSQTNITVTYQDGDGTIDYSVATATSSVLGVASFDSTNFLVTAGDVTIATDGVSATELADNIDMSSAGFNADQVDGTDVNDSGSTTSDLWTASKITSYVDSIASGLSWQESVIDKDLDTPPGAPSTGDRYITSSAPATATGDWAGHDNEISEWDGSAWVFTPVEEGMAVWVEDEDVQYVFNTTWAKLGTTLTHENLIGLQGGNGGNELYHLTSAEHSAIVGSKAANTVFASPDGAGGVGGFRALVSDDIPSLLSGKISDFTEAAQDATGAMITAGTQTNITVTYNDVDNDVDYSVATATSSVLGVASFDSGDFTVTAGNVTINASGVDHGGLTGLADDDHTQYVHISTARTVTAVHTFNPGSATAPFILGANAQGQLVTGLNADMVDGQHWSVAATASAPSSPSTNDIWVEVTA